MTCWLVGASGMLGQAIGHRLQRLGQPWVGTTSQLDIGDLATVLAFVQQHKPTCIINCAAYTQVDQAETATAAAYRVNGLGPRNLALAAQHNHMCLLHISTDYVFDGQQQTPYCEDDPVAPLGVYGDSKRQGEKYIMTIMGTTRRWYIVRTAWLFGHGGNHFVGTMLRLMQNRRQLHVVADQIGSPTYCNDLAAAVLALVGNDGTSTQHPPAAAGIYHWVGEGQISWHGFAQAILQAARQLHLNVVTEQIAPITTAQYPTVAKRPAYSVLSTKKISQVLGHKPRLWHEGLMDYLHSRPGP